MLEDRPILQRSLIGFGAFSFVFSAAMAGTAFMISGGFGLGAGERPRPQSFQPYALATDTAWNDWTQPAYAATTAYVAPAATHTGPESVVEPAVEDADAEIAYAAADDLDGPAARRERIEGRNERDILRDIEGELTAYEVEGAAHAPSQSESDVITAKEQAAAHGHGPY